MITPNTDFTFIQVKFDSSGTFSWQNVAVAEVIEMTTKLRPVEKFSASASRKRKGKNCERTETQDDLLLSVVDETVKQVFREAGAEVIYSFIENKCHLKREEIAERPEVFSASLERLLGSAAPMVEKLILVNLYSKFQVEYEEKEGYGFSDYVKELRGRCGR